MPTLHYSVKQGCHKPYFRRRQYTKDNKARREALHHEREELRLERAKQFARTEQKTLINLANERKRAAELIRKKNDEWVTASRVAHSVKRYLNREFRRDTAKELVRKDELVGLVQEGLVATFERNPPHYFPASHDYNLTKPGKPAGMLHLAACRPKYESATIKMEEFRIPPPTPGQDIDQCLTVGQ